MIRCLLLLAASALAMSAGAFEARLTAGLAVNTEQIPEPVTVDGIPIQVQRATGKGVPELARRIEALWRSQGSEVRARHDGNWTVRSRMRGAMSEVLQWRSDTVAPELLWSSLDAGGSVQRTPDAGLNLPAGCAWGRSVSGRSGKHRYQQRSARCSLSIHELFLQLQHSLPAQGWRLRSATDQGFLVDRPGAEGQVSITTHQGDPATWLIWLRVQQLP